MRQVKHPDWAICLGGASCVWDDLASWEKIYGKPWDGLFIVANDIGAHFPRPIDHWVSLHPSRLTDWTELRRENNMPEASPGRWGQECYQSELDGAIVDYRLMPWPGGSSGMFAAQVARAIGCQKVVLCGIPLTRTPHFAETKEFFHKEWLAAAGHWRGWERAVQDKHIDSTWLRSMSGKTLELLGAPSAAWIHELTAPPA